jgi:hypothetical protein
MEFQEKHSPEKIEKYFENLDDINRFIHHQSDIQLSFHEIYSDKSGNIKIPIYQPSQHMFKISDCQFSPGSFLPYHKSDPIRRYYNKRTLSLISLNPIIDKNLNQWDRYVQEIILNNTHLFDKYYFKKPIKNAKFLKTIRKNYLGPFSQLHGDFIPRDPLSKGSGFIVSYEGINNDENQLYPPKSQIVDYNICGFHINDYDSYHDHKKYSLDISLYPTAVYINFTSTPDIYIWTEFSFHILYVK